MSHQPVACRFAIRIRTLAPATRTDLPVSRTTRMSTVAELGVESPALLRNRSCLRDTSTERGSQDLRPVCTCERIGSRVSLGCHRLRTDAGVAIGSKDAAPAPLTHSRKTRSPILKAGKHKRRRALSSGRYEITASRVTLLAMNRIVVAFTGWFGIQISVNQPMVALRLGKISRRDMQSPVAPSPRRSLTTWGQVAHRGQRP